jgi:DNA repair ATPase RecN
LAPFNRSDAHKATEIADGCSWFRMAEPSIEGLKQVACEPKTRIALTTPPPVPNNAILGMRVSGGYSDGQFFRFNDALNCIVGQNYAGKSAVFDFLRFALGLEGEIDEASRQKLLTRLNGILTPAGTVEIYVRHLGEFYVIKRRFNPSIRGEGMNAVVECCTDQPMTYHYDRNQDALVPVDEFRFPVEVYEQHRISRLRDDVSRQLEMLDEFAAIGGLKQKRTATIDLLTQSARDLTPLYDECEQLRSEVGNLPQLEEELAQKEKLIPGEEEQSWSNTVGAIQAVEEVIDELVQSSAFIPDPKTPRLKRSTQFEQLFAHTVPAARTDLIAHPELASQMRDALRIALEKIEGARSTIAEAIQALQAAVSSLKVEWLQKKQAHEQDISAKLRRAGVESPQEVIDRVGVLRSQINTIKTQKQPRLTQVCASIDQYETARVANLAQLANCNEDITRKRQEKAAELTQALDDQIRISVSACADSAAYKTVLNELCSEIATKESHIQNKEGQLDRVVAKVPPISLARSLKQKGAIQLDDGTTTYLQDLCGITANTQSFLCRIADDIQRLNKLEVVETPDVPQILVKRRGENTFADLRTGLSPGEQSAAILTLALQTRSMPLVLDQPEDELGYNYVVHLIVPKILDAKFSRQLLVITHNANIPVLGDADYVIKMENRPGGEGHRKCLIAASGCFENIPVTKALIELEGGERAFEFRQHRYAMPEKSI